MEPDRCPDRWELDTQPDLVACTPEALDRIAMGEDPAIVEAALRALQQEENGR